MFKTVTAVSFALAVAAGPALAGGLAPVVESEALVVQDVAAPARPRVGVLVPLLLIGALAAVAASSNDDDDDKTGGGRGGDGGGGGNPPPPPPPPPVDPCAKATCQ